MGSTQMPASYEAGANFGDDRMLLISQVDMAGRLSGRVHTQLNDSWLLRCQAQVGPEDNGNSFKADLDYKGSSNCLSGYMMGMGAVGFHALQSITENLALGAEGFYAVNAKTFGGAGAARLSWGGKGENVASAKVGTFGQGSVELAYSRKVSPKVALATELLYFHNQACQFQVGYEFALQKATFKGAIKSDTTCMAALEERITNEVSLQLAGELNHKKKEYKFGVGLGVHSQLFQ